MADPNDKVKKLQDIKAENKTVKSKTAGVVAAPAAGVATPAVSVPLAVGMVATPAQRDELLGGYESLGNPFYAFNEWGREHITPYLHQGVDAVIDWGSDVMNTVGEKVDAGLNKAKNAVKGLLPGKKASSQGSQGSTPAPKGNNNDNEGFGGYKNLLPGYYKNAKNAGYLRNAGRVIRDGVYFNFFGRPAYEAMTAPGTVLGGPKVVERNDATANNRTAYPIERTGQDAAGNNVVWTKTKEGKDTLDIVSKRPDYNGQFDN